jgi:hypothetical protein
MGDWAADQWGRSGCHLGIRFGFNFAVKLIPKKHWKVCESFSNPIIAGRGMNLSLLEFNLARRVNSVEGGHRVLS